MAQRAPFSTGLGISDGTAELGGEGAQKCRVGVVEAASLPLSDQQHTLHPSFVCDWDPQKTLVGSGACLRDETLIEIGWHPVQVHGLAALGDLAYEPLAESELDVSDNAGRETVCRGDDVPALLK